MCKPQEACLYIYRVSDDCSNADVVEVDNGGSFENKYIKKGGYPLKEKEDKKRRCYEQRVFRLADRRKGI